MGKKVWEPGESEVEAVPTALVVSHEQPGIMGAPHWHAQVEVNFVFCGWMDYAMHGRTLRLEAGELALFWGGLPHQVTDTSEDALFLAIHLPLLQYFRLKLAVEMTPRLAHGATLVALPGDTTDAGNFERISAYMTHGDKARRDHAVDELLLRLERIAFAPHEIRGPLSTGAASDAASPPAQANIGAICEFVATNFRSEIDSTAIAASAGVHPKYAMTIFRKSTGMTLNEYVTLLRISYAQALLVRSEHTVLSVAMDCGFGSLSAFNTAFRKVSGRTPREYRRAMTSPRSSGAGSEPFSPQP